MLPISSLLKEWTCVAGIRAFKENNAEAVESGIRTSLPEFLFIRLFSTKLGQAVGVFIGATRRRAASGVIDLHKRTSRIEVDDAGDRTKREGRELLVTA